MKICGNNRERETEGREEKCVRERDMKTTEREREREREREKIKIIFVCCQCERIYSDALRNDFKTFYIFLLCPGQKMFFHFHRFSISIKICT